MDATSSRCYREKSGLQFGRIDQLAVAGKGLRRRARSMTVRVSRNSNDEMMHLRLREGTDDPLIMDAFGTNTIHVGTI